MTPTTCRSDDDLFELLTEAPNEGALWRHVQGCEQCRGRLERLRGDVTSLREALDSIDTGAPPGAGPAVAGRPGAVGKYLVVGVLGEDGPHVAYRGLHPTLNKELVIRLDRRSAPGRPPADEASRLASLEHPNLGRVYDLDVHDGRPFLVREYVPGDTLEDRRQEAAATPARTAALLADAARAVAYAHRRGVVHLHLSPRAVRFDDEGKARLVDFGRAALERAGAAGAPPGGAPGYAAPEQVRGAVEAVGPRTDIFSLGGVLYFLLTGRAPSAGAEQGPIDRGALRTAHPGLAAVCLKCLEADPGRRFADGDALADALEQAVRAPKWPWRLAAAAAALLALGGLVWALWPR
jgi:serine/threonine protein kinase